MEVIRGLIHRWVCIRGFVLGDLVKITKLYFYFVYKIILLVCPGDVQNPVKKLKKKMHRNRHRDYLILIGLLFSGCLIVLLLNAHTIQGISAAAFIDSLKRTMLHTSSGNVPHDAKVSNQIKSLGCAPVTLLMVRKVMDLQSSSGI